MNIPPDFLIMILVAVVVSAAFIILPIPNWLMARRFDAEITFMEAMAMSFRKVNARKILNALSNAAAANIDVTADELEQHAVTGGNVQKVVIDMIRAKKKGLPIYKRDIFNADINSNLK